MTLLGPSRGNSWTVSADHADLVRATVPSRPLSLEAVPQPITIDLSRLTMMTPNEGFAELIRAGMPVTLTDADRTVIGCARTG